MHFAVLSALLRVALVQSAALLLRLNATGKTCSMVFKPDHKPTSDVVGWDHLCRGRLPHLDFH
jgi:hypothetical protein